MGVVIIFCLWGIYVLQKRKCIPWLKGLFPQLLDRDVAGPGQESDGSNHHPDDIEMEGTKTPRPDDVPV
jgi:hypothetical protein